MVVLTSRFTLLASLAAIASFALFPSRVDGAAIQLNLREPHSSNHFKAADSHTSANSAGDDQRSPPVVPLPERKHSSKDKLKGKERAVVKDKQSSKKSKKTSDKEKRNPGGLLDPLLEIDALGLCLGIHCPSKREDLPLPLSGEQHVHVHTGHDDDDDDDDHDQFSVMGQDNTIHFDRRSPSPEPHNHDRHRSNKNKLVVNGDRDHIDVYDKRSPAPHDHDHDRHRDGHGGDRDRHHSKVVVNGDDNDIDYHHKRDLYQLDGVPGSIDIMSQVSGSAMGQKIASLALTPFNKDGTVNTGDPFILNASGNSTQVYLVSMPDDAPSNQTSPDASTSNSTMPGSSSNSTEDSFKKVAIQIPIFYTEEVSLERYCATFDPRPPSPAPLTVERCTDGNQTDPHKSQIFAYEPLTGAIRPMLFKGDNEESQESFPDSSDDSELPEDDLDDSPDDESVARVDPQTPLTSKMVAATGLKEAMMDEEYGNATRPPNAMASLVKSLSADNDEDYTTAKNVTLVFTPAVAAIPVQASNETVTPQEKLASSSADPYSYEPYEPTNSTSGNASNSTSSSAYLSMTMSSGLPTSTAASTTLASTGSASTGSATHTFAAAEVSATSVNATSSSMSHSVMATANSTSLAASSTSSTATATFSPFAAFAATTSLVPSSISSSSIASSTGLSSSMIANSTSTGTASPTASPLDVEVYDPNASSSTVSTTSTSMIGSSTGIPSNSSMSGSNSTIAHGSNASSTPLSMASSNATATTTSSSASATLTPFKSG